MRVGKGHPIWDRRKVHTLNRSKLRACVKSVGGGSPPTLFTQARDRPILYSIVTTTR